ncbi:hypothetical protein BDC45DRAFT_571750 [Circinella umbellata]|nr:hypothetical protein BDC45DRAFT_571750 [Circinella umbellata]
MKTFPNSNSIIPHKKGVKVLAEINFNSEEVCTLAINKGIDFTPEINIRATRALHKKAKIKKLRLTDLPLLSEQPIWATGLPLWIYKKKKENLNHPILWCGNKDDLIYVYFEGMLLFCSRCHQPDYYYEDCPRLHYNQQQQKCFHCGGFDHYNTICPKEHNATLWSPGNNKTNFTDFKINLPMIPADEQELAINKPPTSDWVDSLELSDKQKRLLPWEIFARFARFMRFAV